MDAVGDVMYAVESRSNGIQQLEDGLCIPGMSWAMGGRGKVMKARWRIDLHALDAGGHAPYRGRARFHHLRM